MVLEQEHSKSRTGAVMLMLIMILIVPMSAGILFINNESHANARHTTADTVRNSVKKGGCEIWYSPPRGTTLELCNMGGGQLGGRVVRLATSTGELYNEKSYECTAFVARQSYWRNVISRDGYQPAPQRILDALKVCNGGR